MSINENTLAQKKKQIALPAVLALVGVTTAVAVAATLILGAGQEAEIIEVQPDLSTDTADGSVLNAEAILTDAESLLEAYSTQNEVELASSPAQSLCLFVREATDEGFIEAELACGPTLHPRATSGAYLSLSIDFDVTAEGVTASIPVDAGFQPADFAGRELFRPDGKAASPANIFASVASGFDSNDLPRRLWSVDTVAPNAMAVEIGDSEPLPDFEPVSTDYVEFLDGSEAKVEVTEAHIVRSVIDPLTGEEFVNEEKDTVWVQLDFTDTTPHGWMREQTVENDYHMTYTSGTWLYTAEWTYFALPEDADSLILRVPLYEDDLVGAIRVALTSDAGNAKVDSRSEHMRTCTFPWLDGYLVEKGFSTAFIYANDENTAIWDGQIQDGYMTRGEELGGEEW